MLFGSLPLSVFAAGAADGDTGSTGQKEKSKPIVHVSSAYGYRNPERHDDYRALPNLDGVFAFDIYIPMDDMPTDGRNVVVFYRTVDDSAVSEWGDYESIGTEAETYVTLSQANAYRARVTVNSKIIDNGFILPDESGKVFDPNSIFSRRFIFEVTGVSGLEDIYEEGDENFGKYVRDTDTEEISDRCNFYCYLLALSYCKQTNSGGLDNSGYISSAEHNFALILEALDELIQKAIKNGDNNVEAMFAKVILEEVWGAAETRTYDSLFKSLGQGALINTPKMNVGSSYSWINLSFDDTWRSYLSSGWCDVGISMSGILTRESKSGEGPVTFDLYYKHEGVQKLALSLKLQGKFHEITQFGWQQALLYAVDGVESDYADKFMEDNFVSLTVYDNSGNVDYEVKMKDRSKSERIRVCNELNTLVKQGKIVLMHGSSYPYFTKSDEGLDVLSTSSETTLTSTQIMMGLSEYYLRLPSNFAFADSYYYSIQSSSTNSSEVRWVEDANLGFTLLAKGLGEPSIKKIDDKKQLVTSNVDQLKAGDPLKVMIRFDQPVYVIDPEKCYITLDVNGTFPVTLKLKHNGYKVSDTELHYYSCDTLVFEGSIAGFTADKIESLRNLKLQDGSNTSESAGIKSFLTGRNLVGKTLVDLYGYDKDMRAAVATVSVKTTEGTWSKSRSLDLYLNVTGTSNRFVDYATVYYQWSNSDDLEDITFDSSIVFHTAVDGEIMKTIIGTGNGYTYLHIKTVSSFGKVTYSDRLTGTYDPNQEGAVYTPFGEYWFDNTPPELLPQDISFAGNVREQTVTVNHPRDLAGLGSMSLYYVPHDSENGEGVLLDSFTSADFDATTSQLKHTIKYTDVGMTEDDGWREVDFYWILSDTLGNESAPSGRFSLAFDTQDYLEVGGFVPDGNYANLSEKLDDLNYIYDFETNKNQVTNSTYGTSYYTVKLQLDISGFLGQDGTDSGKYGVIITHKGARLVEMGCKCLSSENDNCKCAQAELAACDHSCGCDDCNLDAGEYDYSVEDMVDYANKVRVFTVNIHREMTSGQYKIYLTRTQAENSNVQDETEGTDDETNGTDDETEGTEGETEGTGGETEGTVGETEGTDSESSDNNGKNTRTSQAFSIYATAAQKDNTTTKDKIDSGTLLINTVYQLSAVDPYYYYKDQDGVPQKEYYNGEKKPATFSSSTKAKEYVLFCEYSDIYLYQIPSTAIADALNSGAPGYRKADGELAEADVGQYWIRYKSKSWTPTSGDSAWVYYYYGKNKLSKDALSTNVVEALNAVANRIVSYGRSVTLTDNSLFLGSALGEKLLDSYGMPYLLRAQVHSDDEHAPLTKCNDEWAIPIAYAGDKNIYRSVFEFASDSDGNLIEYPIVGNFKLSDSSIYQYMTLANYEKFINPTTSSGVKWNNLTRGKDQNFIDVFTGSGIYYIREMSEAGVCVYPICIDKEAPEVTFEIKTSTNGDLKKVNYNGKDQLKISAMQLYVNSISSAEYDNLAYVAIYKMSNLALVKVYTVQDLKRGSVKIDDGKYYIVIADRSGNRYTLTADINVSALECEVKESTNSYIKLTCNRSASQIMVYEVYRNGELVTSTYANENTFRESGNYSIYVRDIYGNEYLDEVEFVRNYPKLTWKYYGTDDKYHTYVSPEEGGVSLEESALNGFVETRLSEGNYKISAAVKIRFVLADSYQYEFMGVAPNYTVSSGTEHNVTIDAGQSFALKVYYKSHPDCYTIYTGVVDVTPPSISVVADEDLIGNGEDGMFDFWLTAGKVNMDKLYVVLNGVGRTNVKSGSTVNSDIIKINASDANDLSVLEVYLDETLIERQTGTTGFPQIIVNRWGSYRIVAKDTLGNVSTFTFTNGMPDNLRYFIDGAEKELELHSTDYFNSDHVYTKTDYGKSDFTLNVKENADVFMSMEILGGAAKIYGFRIADGKIYPITYEIVEETRTDPDTKEEYKIKSVELVVGAVVLDTAAEGFKAGTEYTIKDDGAHRIFASVSEDMTVSIKAYASEDATKILSINARVEFVGSNTFFVSAELSKKSSNIAFEGIGLHSGSDVRANEGFTVDESVFESERIESVSLYYSRLNDLDKDSLSGRENIYVSGMEYTDEGFYLLVVRNLFGIEKVYKISVSRSFGITSSVVFLDGHEIYYSKDHNGGVIYSNNMIILDIIEEDVVIAATRNGEFYDDYRTIIEDSITYLVFYEEGNYSVTLTDSYGNPLTRQLEINKASYSVSDELLVGFNEKALKRDEGYTNQKLSIDKSVFEGAGIYYLAIRYGETETVLFDSFAEIPVLLDEDALADAIGNDGDGVYTVVCRNRYGALESTDIHYRGTPTLKLERTTRSQLDPMVYSLEDALSIGFWSNNTLVFSTEANTYVFTVNGNATECPRTLVFENSGDYGSFEYDISYIDEYGFEYSFKAYLLRKNINIDLPASITGIDVDGVLNTTSDISVTFEENTYATYTRNNGEAVAYRSGEVLKQDGTYRFTVIDYAGNASTLTVKKDTAVEFVFEVSDTGATIQNGGVVNSSKISFDALNKDSAYIEKVLKDGVLQADFTGSKFTGDGKWEIVLADKLGNKAYFTFYIITKAQNGFEYTTPYEYSISEMWYDAGDGVKVSYMSFITHTDSGSSFKFTENGKYTVVMSSEVTGITTTFNFTINTTAPDVQLVGCNVGETTINDVTIAGCKIGDRIRVYLETDGTEKLVEEIEVSATTQMPTITEGGKYRIVVESEAGVETELAFVRKHVMNTAGSVFIMVLIGLSVVGLFTGLIYRNKSKTDD